MSLKRVRNVAMREYSSSEESVNNDQSDVDYEVMSSGRSGRSSKNEGSILSGGRNCRGSGNRGSTKRPCLNRNALLARENRRRKKEYLETIENKLSYFKQENKNLSNTIQRQDIDLKRLKGEVSYLRNILNNSSSITNLLRSMNESLSNTRTAGSETGSNRKRREIEDSKWQHGSPWNEKVEGGKYRDQENSKWQHGSGWNTKSEEGKHCDANAGMRERLSAGDSDHTYTTSSRDDSEENLYSIDNNENLPYLGNNDSLTFKDDFDLDLELDRLPQFDENIFNSVDNLDENPSNDLENYNSTKLFDNLDNSGICLHVNSGKISLEFCSICHLNSVNSIEAAELGGNQVALGIVFKVSASTTQESKEGRGPTFYGNPRSPMKLIGNLLGALPLPPKNRTGQSLDHSFPTLDLVTISRSKRNTKTNETLYCKSANRH